MYPPNWATISYNKHDRDSHSTVICVWSPSQEMAVWLYGPVVRPEAYGAYQALPHVWYDTKCNFVTVSENNFVSTKLRLFKACMYYIDIFSVTNLWCVVWKQRRLMCAAKKAIGKMPLRTLRNGDEVSFIGCYYQINQSCSVVSIVHFLQYAVFWQMNWFSNPLDGLVV